MRREGIVHWPATGVLICLLSGCGGSTSHSGNEGSPGSGDTGGDRASGGVSASGGALTGSSGAGATAATDAGGAPDQTLDAFDSPNRQSSLGLWMGFPGDSVPIGMPSVPHDGSALHLVGKTDDAGLDVFFHTPLAVEKMFQGVRFWAQSELVGSKLTVAVAGPEPSYFTDRAQGVLWPQRVITLSRAWQEVVVDFRDWGLDPDHLSPHSEYYGAFHFVIEPNTAYDLWIDDFAGQRR
jgi:hypothetical protein